MTEQFSPEQVAFEADLDRLRAQVGAARLAEAETRDVGLQMLFDAADRTMAANEAAERMKSIHWFQRPAEPGWGWDDNE